MVEDAIGFIHINFLSSTTNTFPVIMKNVNVTRVTKVCRAKINAKFKSALYVNQLVLCLFLLICH